MQLKHYHILLLLLVSATTLKAQSRTDSVTYSINSRFSGGTGTYAPFLSTANQYDRYSFSPNSLTTWGTLHKEINDLKHIDYEFGAELDGNLSENESRFFPGELYIQGKLHFLNMYMGMKQEIFGNQDPELSSGGMLWSANSRPMPKIAIQSHNYVAVPYTKGYLEVKAGLSHGWFDNQKNLKGLLLHHKYGYIRVGGTLPLTINYGVQHVAQWGGQSNLYGTMPVNWNNYFRIFMGHSGSSSASWEDQENALGNHIISQNLGLDLKLKFALVSFYWQSIAEDSPVVKFITNTPTIEDGLWGTSVTLPRFQPLNHFVLEYLSTTDQNGPWHDLDGVIYGGLDGYYSNGLIPNGWSYKGMTIGNPWLTSPNYNKDGSTSVVNNTVRLYYFSGKGMIKTFNYRLTLAYSENFGSTAPIYRDCKKQFSWQLETSTSVNRLKNIELNLGISGDHGTMYGNNIAILLGFSYTGFWEF
ncbi:MAG TPA: hypothetical protein DHV48_06580 [Prolixibacteraceae bacterium]|nr:hypothetical protein [Prolixibacteraceae bacterium]